MDKQTKLSMLPKKLRCLLFYAMHPRLFIRLRHTIILVYTMAKVGSMTVRHNLQELIEFKKIFHIHNLTLEGIAERERFEGTERITQQERKARELLLSRDNYRAKIITLVRDPISRELSNVFHNIEHYLPGRNPDQITLAEIQKAFENVGHGWTLNWFDKEFKTFLGEDIFSYPFDPAKGYEIYNWPKADILVLRLEDLNRVYQKAIWEFLGIRALPLRSRNVNEGKKTSSLYNEFKNQFRLNSERAKLVYGSKLATHFYSPQEIENFISKWQGSPAESGA